MRSRSEPEPIDADKSERELHLLTEVSRDPEITQRQLSQRVGLSLGLTNVVLRNLAQKGYIRATQAGWKHWLYNLTPKGISHKVQLTVSYIGRVMDDFDRVRQTLAEQLDPLGLNEESSIAIVGSSEFAELVFLGLKDHGIDEIDVFGPCGGKFLGMPVREVESLVSDRYDWVLLAILDDAGESREGLIVQGISDDKMVSFFRNGRVVRNGQ
jgi:DNA-binding MarR family transcriptional regulator